MKTNLITTLTALLMLVGIGAQAQTDNQTRANAESTDLEGDLNHDGKVDVTDVTYLVNLIMKNQSEAKDGTYYWYIGVDNPASISDIQTDNTKPGWHEIGTSLDGFVLDATKTDNQVILNTENVKYYYYVVIPNDLHIYESSNTSNVENIYFDPVECNIAGYKAFQYKVDPGTRTVKGIIIKESNEPINDNFYWYIGVDNPASISDIQTDNTKPGWHEIGASLSGFTHDMNNQANWITLVENPTSTDQFVSYYVIIPNGVSFKDAVGSNLKTNGEYSLVDCNISGYEAYKYNNTTSRVRGIIFEGYIPVSGVSILTSESSINVGNTLQLEATVSPSNATNQNVTWSSSNPAVATIGETTGLVTGVAVGSATITATSVDGGKTATATVNVVETLSGYYWYAGATLPTSISNIQTDNTKPGWHSIGTSLAGFEHDMNNRDNWITIVENATSEDDLIHYYIVIPDGITFRDALGTNLKTNGDFTPVDCNISGYEAYKSTDTTARVRGLIFEGPVD